MRAGIQLINWELLTTNIVTAKHIKSVTAFISCIESLKNQIRKFCLAETKGKSQVEIRLVKCGGQKV